MFFEFTIYDFLDILFVAILLYYVYKLMKESGSFNVFLGVLIFIVAWLFVSKSNMRLLASIFDKFASVGILALIILFQKEIRRFFLNLGLHYKDNRFVHFFVSPVNRTSLKKDIESIAVACRDMSLTDTGALIIKEGDEPLESMLSTKGVVIDARISDELIENIFYKGSPIHDGAMLIGNGRIKLAGALLPTSNDAEKDVLPRFRSGARHSTGYYFSTLAPTALVIVVSEECGNITIMKNGKYKVITKRDVEKELDKLENLILSDGKDMK